MTGAYPPGHSENNPFPVGSKLCGGVQNPGVLTPASLQIAQLQAQLTLQRLKLAQTAMGGNAAAAASVLNQVLANVPISQPLLNQLRSSAITTVPHGQAGGPQLVSSFPTGTGAFPTLTSGLETLGGGGGVGGLSAQNSQSSGLFPGGFPQTSLGLGGGTMFPSGADRPSQYGFLSTPTSAVANSSDGRNAPPSALAKTGPRPGFQRDLYGTCRPDSQSGFGGEQNREAPKTGYHKGQQWESPASFSNSGKGDTASGSGGVWVGSGQPFRGCELYNPEEPTADGKYGHPGRADYSASSQGIVGSQQPRTGELSLSRAPTALQPHQRNDFHGVTPSHLPHHCTICDKKVFNLTDWDHHVNGKLHLQNRSLYTDSSFSGSVHFPPFSSGCFSSTTNNSMSFSSAGQDISPGPNPVYLPSAPMKTQDVTGNGFTSSQTGSKFPQRKTHFSGRVVHICNLPEGSTENDVINLGLPFGKVTNYILMRSTYQAFLEMAFMEAAQAMVQYYQLNPATINDQKLLIRMSKRYQELQLKKPGKDVESIIQDINSQREREEVECYPQERARSRSPIPRPLSPRPHSPGYASCGSAHSPQGAGWGERAGKHWDWSSHDRWEEERGESSWRNGERGEDCWRNEDRNGGDPPNDSWPHDHRKSRPKPTDRWSSRMDDRRGSRERYPRSSPPDRASPYRSKDEDFYKMADWSPRHHQHSEGRAKRRDVEGLHRARQAEPEAPEAATRTLDDRKSGSPVRGRSRKQSPKQEIEKEEESENQVEASMEQPLKEKSVSPRRKIKQVDEPESERGRDSEGEGGRTDSDIEEESWYPQNMEELVTVDEVGGEDDDIIEPDLPQLLEKPAAQNVAMGDARAEDGGRPGEEGIQSGDTQEDSLKPPPQEPAAKTSGTHPEDQTPAPALTMEEPSSDQSSSPSEDPQAISEEPRSHTDAANVQPPQESPNHTDSMPSDTPISCVANQSTQITKATDKEVHDQDVHFADIPLKDTCRAPQPAPSSADVDQTGLHDKAVSEHSIPLGVEFVVPRSGFFCKLCGLFYTSEETAKIAHCRSVVHYKNLQKYLSQLATGSLDGMDTSSANREEPCLVPHSKEKNCPAGDELN
ncbi:RNA-binding protein 20-like [Conger conger]|uniref:RNA-binding protein 20-like n=1 Tax=Conger conger TaxID=82655 RepID=UPI002A5A503C|nr:RNA-binding protein 20-like [Conger conger]